MQVPADVIKFGLRLVAHIPRPELKLHQLVAFISNIFKASYFSNFDHQSKRDRHMNAFSAIFQPPRFVPFSFEGIFGVARQL